MSSVKLLIRPKRVARDGRCVIYALYTHSEKSVWLNTGEKIPPEHWNEKDQCVRSSYRKDWKEMNDSIEDFRLVILQKARRLRLEGIDPSIDQIKREMALKKTGKDNTLLQLVEDFISSRKSGSVVSEGQMISYEYMQRYLRGFSRETSYPLFQENINMEFYNRFFGYLNEKGLKNNTIARIITCVKTAINWADDRFIIPVSIKRFKLPKEDTSDMIALDESELNQFASHPLPPDTPIERSRDAFVFSCCTGLRFSDIKKLQGNDVMGDHVRIYIKKTGRFRKVPLVSHAIRIAEKYKSIGFEKSFFNLSGNSKVNQMLKMIAFGIGMTQEVSKVRHSGSRSITVVEKRYEQVGVHTARRTFISLSIAKGVSPRYIMEVTGISSFKTIQRYIRINDSKVADEMRDAWR